ncbi:hypothetical protein ACRALDRAFT_1065630 [Sodiomyces alcalophilus JCM 7366]|uniref:uncharacterized protein n=1 Tax=Sodiomyces alcalophilus JCM 7366 TaxID=591952 RepID=UPI0039B410EF
MPLDTLMRTDEGPVLIKTIGLRRPRSQPRPWQGGNASTPAARTMHAHTMATFWEPRRTG